MQKFHELPRKISLENWGQIVSKAVDVRAFVTFNPEHQTIDIQLFGREWNIWKVSNVSSGWKFTKIYTVPDVSYYGIQKKINDLISTLWDSQNNAIEKYFDDYARKNFKVLPEAKIAHIPFVLSESGTIRIVNLVQKLVHNMVDVSFIKRNSEGWIIGNTVIGVDISVNPLPKD